MGRGVRTRKDLVVGLMKEEHDRFISSNPGESTFRIVSLGCGPAREVSDFVAQNRTWDGAIAWTLIDQEEEALSVAYRDSRREIGRWGSNARLNLLNLSFVQLLSEGVPLQEPGSASDLQRVVHYQREQSAGPNQGLFDSCSGGLFTETPWRQTSSSGIWVLVDWTLFYRTRQEMLVLASCLRARMSGNPGAFWRYYFLLVRKH
jgi:hypothetical protein